MKKLALVAIVVLAGCAAGNTQTGVSDPKLTQLEEESRIVTAREKQCIEAALERSREELARMAAAPNTALESRLQKEKDERDREVSQCRASADYENAEISAHERRGYELEGQREHDRAALIMTLTASGTH